MNIIYTYWTNKGTDFRSGFQSEESLFRVFKESVSQSNKLSKKIPRVFTDREGADKLNKLGLILDFTIVDYPTFDERFWNYAKIITYSLQTEPFLHIDMDVVLKDNFTFPTTAIFTELYRPCKESSLKYSETLNKVNLLKDFTKNPFIICSGLLGFNELSVLKEYTSLAKEVVFSEHEFVADFKRTAVEEFILSALKNKYNISLKELSQDTFRHYQGELKKYI